jgi:hypothetical protein
MFRTNVVEKVKTQILFSIVFPESRAVYEIMWKNVVYPDMATASMPWACRTTNAADALLLNANCVYMETMVKLMRLNFTLICA